MIKLLREAAHDYPWFLKSIMGLLALAFVITMGWWGFGQEGGNVVASVGDQVVPLDEYRRAYENTYRFYKDKGQNDIKDEFLKQFVLEQLIDNRMWLHVAKEMGLTVSDEDLRKAIMQRTEFQKNGNFDPEAYRRLLSANRLTPLHSRPWKPRIFSPTKRGWSSWMLWRSRRLNIRKHRHSRLAKGTPIRPRLLRPRSGFSKASCFRSSNGR